MREPDLTAVNRALSVTVQKQEAELDRLHRLLAPFACGCATTDDCLPNCPRFAAKAARGKTHD